MSAVWLVNSSYNWASDIGLRACV